MNEPQAASTIRSTLGATCPRCSRGPLFVGRVSLSLRKSCDRCGLDYGFAEAGDGPAVFAIFILGVLVLAGAMIAEFKLGIPYLYHMPFWALATPLLALWLLRRLKAALMAIQFSQQSDGTDKVHVPQVTKSDREM
ncbi:MAG: DUF983 domain-containing protein [Hyphomicrobiaceae bacterium]